MITWICSAVSDPDDQEFLIELYEEFPCVDVFCRQTV